MTVEGESQESMPPPPPNEGGQAGPVVSQPAGSVAVYCTSCGAAMDANAWVCMACGVPRMTVKRHCWHCGTQIDANQAVCINCGASLAGVAVTPKSDKRVLAGVMGILFGAFGVHKFILGYTTEGLIMLLVTVLTLGIGGIVMAIIGIIEGITYLTKSDAEFQSTYVVGKKGWF